MLQRLHRISTFTLLALTVLFVLFQFRSQPGYYAGNAIESTDQRFFGWPRVMLDRTTTQSRGQPFLLSTTKTINNTVDDLNITNLCVNFFVGVIVIASTIFCMERWLRRSNRWQFRLRDAATLLLVGSLVFSFYDPAFQHWALPSIGLFPHIGFDVEALPMHLAIPFFVAAYLVVYAGCAIVGSAISIAVSHNPTNTAC